MNTSENLTNIVESILFGAGRPMRLSEIRSLLGTQNIEALKEYIDTTRHSPEDWDTLREFLNIIKTEWGSLHPVR